MFFFGTGAFFCFFALGGVLERSESSWMEGSDFESSSSVSGLGRFFDDAGFFGFKVVCDTFVDAALGAAAAFLGAALGFDFAF